MEGISDDLLTQCMHCGLCLSVCPTYALTGLERSSPRGRIRLMKSVMERKIPISATFVEEMDFCLDCQACETACPAGVKYGELVESARVLVEERRKRFSFKQFILTKIVVRKRALRLAAKMARFYEKSGFEKVTLVVLKLLSKRLYNRARLLPRISRKFAFDVVPSITDPKEEVRGTVAILTGCVMDVFYADVNKDTVDVLAENGWRVVIPQDQVCCGSLNAHNGDDRTPRALARKNIEAFERSGADYYVINSAGCGAFMKQYGEILSDDEEFADRAKRFSSKVKDFSEFLYETGYKRPSAGIGRATVYHEACHLVHAQKVSTQPKAIVTELSGENFRELNEATWCCGSAGIYNVTRHEDASKLLDRKLKNIQESNAEVVVTGNPGCLAQIGAGIRNGGLKVEALHPATVLNRLYKSGKV